MRSYYLSLSLLSNALPTIMQISCPHCSTALNVTQEHIGQQVQCPACQNRFQIPEATTPPTGTGNQKPARKGWEEKDHANVNFGKSLLVGAGITILFMLLMVPFKNTRMGGLFLDRGWVNYAETFLFFWGCGALCCTISMNGLSLSLSFFSQSIDLLTTASVTYSPGVPATNPLGVLKSGA